MDSPHAFISAANFLEIGIVILRSLGADRISRFESLIDQLKIHIEPVLHRHAGIALQAYNRFGKGQHPAGLNFGDCFAYALAKDKGEPLLFKGEDFAKCDIEPALGR